MLLAGSNISERLFIVKPVMRGEGGVEGERVLGFATRSHVLVGRRSELEALQSARRALAQSRGALVLIGGEAGIGKSRLVASFVRHSTEGRLRNVLLTECLENAPRPYGPIRSFLTKLAPTVHESAYSKRALRALVQLVPEVAGSGAVSAHTGTPLDTNDLFESLLEIAAAIASRRATIFCIDDIQWADRSTLDVLEYLASRIAAMRLMIVCTYRSESLQQQPQFYHSIAALSSGPASKVIDLSPLSEIETAELIDVAAGGIALKPSLRDTIQRHAEGNPFFAEELVRNAMAPATGSASELPLSIRAGILHRVALLAPDDRQIISNAAVLGFRFSPAILAAVMNRPLNELVSALARARSANLVVEEKHPSQHCRFRHALTRQIIYDDLFSYERQLLHNQIVAALEAVPAAEEVYEDLAYHAHAAHDAKKTLLYSERAGERAVAIGAKADAAAHFQRALETAIDGGDRVRLLEALGGIAQAESRLQDAMAILGQALELRVQRGEFDEAAKLMVSISAERSNAGMSHVEVVNGIECFLAAHETRLAIGSRDHLRVFAARLLTAAQDFEAGDRLLAAVVAAADLPPRAYQNFLTAHLNTRAFLGDLAGWLRYAEAMRALVPSLEPLLEILGLYVIVQTGCYLGAGEAVDSALDEAERLAEKWDFSGLTAWGAAVATVHYWLHGRLHDARRCIERALERPDVIPARTTLANIGPLVSIALGERELGARCFGPGVLESARECEIPDDTAMMLGVYASWLAAGGRVEEARADLRTALEIMRRAAPSAVVIFSAAARFLPPDEVEHVLERVARGAEAPNGLAATANAAFVRAILAQRCGSHETRVLASDAAGAYRELGWPLFEAQALELAGRIEEAQAIYERCGAVGFIPRRAPLRDAAPASTGSGLRNVLSAREQQVAEAVTLGSTNATIADRLGISTKTVEKHLSSIFAKLGVQSRAEIAAFIARGSPHGEAKASR